MVPHTFYTELSKIAVSMGRVLAAVERRMGQGAMVGQKSLQELQAGAAAGLTSTGRGARRTALYAAEAGRDAQRMQQAVNNPVTNATRARLNEGSAMARSGRAGVHDPRRPLPDHYDHGPNPDAGFAYTREHINRMAGQSQIQDPRGLIARSNMALAKTIPPPASGTAVTALSAPRPVQGTMASRPLAGKRPVVSNTGVTAIAPPNLANARPNTAITTIGNQDFDARKLLHGNTTPGMTA